MSLSNPTTNVASSLATRWTHMWNDDASLATELVTDDFRMWLGGTGAITGPVTPVDLVQVVRAYQRDTPNKFHPVTLVDGVDHNGNGSFALSWNAVLHSGIGIIGGTDLYSVRNGRIVENWTIPATHPHQWSTAAEPVTIIGPDQDGAILAATQSLHPRGTEDVRLAHRPAIVDAQSQRAAVLWSSTVDGTRVGAGIDVLQLRHDRVHQVWSVLAKVSLTF